MLCLSGLRQSVLIVLSRAMRNDGSGSYCSRACKDKALQARRGPAHPRWVEPVTRICPVCGKPFPVKPGRVKEYCSRECWARAVGENTGPNSPRWIEREKRVCKQCSTEFDIERWRVARGGGTYCSLACLIEAQRGPGATNWQGGRSYEPYCFRFNKEFKQRVRLFFGNVCFVCGKTPDENGKNLHVHHVDGNPQTCCDDSPPVFVPLCNSCHLRVRHNGDAWRQHFHARIAEDHGGRCFLSKDEYLRRDEQQRLIPTPEPAAGRKNRFSVYTLYYSPVDEPGVCLVMKASSSPWRPPHPPRQPIHPPTRHLSISCFAPDILRWSVFLCALSP